MAGFALPGAAVWSMSTPASAAASTSAGVHPAADCANNWAARSLPRRLSQPVATSLLNSATCPRRIALSIRLKPAGGGVYAGSRFTTLGP